MKNPCIFILLASFNGDKFIGHQIESIINQSYTNWKLWIRDDCSTDNTLSIIKKYIKIDERIILIENNGVRLGAQLNFGSLIKTLSVINFDYCMFSDQDDVWYKDKVLHSLNAIKENQLKDNYYGPVLLHTDFQYADVSLNEIKTTANVAVKLSKVSNKIALIANDNYIFGCTMMLNSNLLKLSTPVSVEAENHDFWVALHAAAFGKIYYLNEKTMFYRQHEKNVSGGLKYSSWKTRIARLANFNKYIVYKRKRSKQFEAFISKERQNFDKKTLNYFERYLKYLNLGGFTAVIFMMKNGFKLRSFFQTAIFYITVFIDKKNHLF